MYLIIKKITYDHKNVDDNYFIVDQTKDKDIALDKLRGYRLIETRKEVSYSIVNHLDTLVLTKEMKIAS